MDNKIFTSREEEIEVYNLLKMWADDSNKTKDAFVKLLTFLTQKKNTVLSFKSRPGVTYSLRALNTADKKERPLFVMVDIIDDNPEERWLSVCFYADMITDPVGNGDIIPAGLLGEDGLCFDVFGYEESMISYLEKRIDEAHACKVRLT